MSAKKILTVFLTFFPILFLSCGNDSDAEMFDPSPGEPEPEIRQSYGTISASGEFAMHSDGDYFILDDDGRTILIGVNLMKDFLWKEGQRVTFQYRIDSELPWELGVDGYNITLYAIREVSLRTILKRSRFKNDESFEEDLGNDPLSVRKENWWIGGRYINLIYEIPAIYEDENDYALNLIYEDYVEDESGNSEEESDKEVGEGRIQTIELVLRYNARREFYPEDPKEMEISAGIISFNINSLGLEKGEYKFVVHWNQFDLEEDEMTLLELEETYKVE